MTKRRSESNADTMDDLVTLVQIVLLFCAVLVGPMGHNGLALATTLASAVNCAILFVILRRKIGRFGGKEVVLSGLKSLGASLAMGIVVSVIVLQSGAGLSGDAGRTVLVAVCLAVGLVTYITASRLLGITELAFLKGFFLKRGKKEA